MGTIFQKQEQEFRATSELDAELSAQLRRIDVELAVLARADAKAAAQSAVATPSSVPVVSDTKAALPQPLPAPIRA